MTSAIRKVIDLLGGNVVLAEKIGVHPSFISQVATGRRAIPYRYCELIEEITDNAITRYELRPDVYGEATKKTKERGA